MQDNLRRYTLLACALMSGTATLTLVTQPDLMSTHRLMVVANAAASAFAMFATWLEWGCLTYSSSYTAWRYSDRSIGSALEAVKKMETNDELLSLLRKCLNENYQGGGGDATLAKGILELLDKHNASSSQVGAPSATSEVHSASCEPPIIEWKDSVGLIDLDSGLKSRRCFDLILSTEIEKARQRGTSMALVLMYFSQLRLIKNKHGAIAVAELIRWIAGRVTSSVRGRDIVGRFGSHEIVMLLPMTNGLQAATVVQNIQAAFDDVSWVAIGSAVKYRIAPLVGMVEYVEGETSGALIRRLEEELSMARSRSGSVSRTG